MTQVPVARVIPLLGVPHLDRLFDYEVPEKWDAQAQPGVRVRIRFAGRLIDGFIIERRRQSDHTRPLKTIERVISEQVVLPSYMWEIINVLAQRTAGTRADLLRSFIPSRHAAAEKAGLFGNGAAWPELFSSLVPVEELRRQALKAACAQLQPFRHGEAFFQAVACGKAARASVLVPPGSQISQLVAALSASIAWGVDADAWGVVADAQDQPTDSSHGASEHPDSGQVSSPHGASVLVIAPNGKTVDRITDALTSHVSSAQVTQMTASEGPTARYRRYLSILHGQARIVVGTRAAALVPLHNLRLIIVVNEADDSLVDPRAPYVHARDIARIRSEQQQCALLFASVHRCAETQQWIEEGFMHPLEATREHLQACLPRMRALDDSDATTEREIHTPGARLPGMGFEAIRSALEDNLPALVQVPRRGYAPGLSCARCRTPARCRRCNGPLELSDASHGQPSPPRCRWCGHTAGNFRCMTCGNHSIRMNIIGHDRTAEELGRAFPGVPVVTSGGHHVRDSVPACPGIVVATPGAEPTVVDGLYGALVVMDPWIALGRADLRAHENALRQWMDAAVQVRSAADGGAVVINGPASATPIDALLRWEPAAAAAMELEHRRQAQFPPSVALAAIDGTIDSIDALLECWERPDSVELLGPVELPSGIRLPAGLEPHRAGQARRLIARVGRDKAAEFGRTLKVAQSVRSSRSKSTGSADPLRVVVDPVRIG